jgi:hypothetical protein
MAIDNGYSGYIERCDELATMIEERPDPFVIPHQEVAIKELLISEGKEATRKHLEIMWIDLKNPDKLTKEAILPALDEMDPTEFLGYCEHFRISYISTSMVGQSIGLPSMGMKAIWCKYKGGAIGHGLKEMTSRFQSTKCNNCKNRAERSKEWTYKIKDFEELNMDPEFQQYLDKMVKAMEKE